MGKRISILGIALLLVSAGASSAAAPGQVLSSVAGPASHVVKTAPQNPTPPAAVPRVDSPPPPPTGLSTGANERAARPIGGVVAETAESAGTVAGLPTEGARKAGSVALGAKGRSDGGGSANAGAPERSVESARPAPLRRWLAHVWPAIALGPFNQLFAALRARLELAASIPAAGVARPPSEPLSGVLAAGASDEGRRPTANSSGPVGSRDLSLPDGAQVSLFVVLASLAAMLTLLVFAVRREMGLPHRRQH